MNNKIISKVISSTILCSMVAYTVPVFGYTKDETVYSKLDASGNNYKTIVSTHIQNSNNEEIINDISDLLNIKNTSGNETYTQDGTKFSWNSNKNDIYYQGETSKELPIECSVKYELNGSEVSKEDIVGKSGNVKITLQYTNKEERTVDINGKKIKMYVPFVVVAGTIIENDNNKNITVSNGKVVDDGTKTVVVGMAMPGLQESLGLSDNDMKIPNNIEISMDAKEFESGSIVSYVTPKVLEKEDLSVFDKMDEMYSKVSTLQSSMNKIQDGANTLKDGAQTYSEKSKEFNSAMSQVATGTSTLNNNYVKVDNGTKELKNGATTLNSGVSELSKGVQTLNTKVGDAKTQISTELTATATQMNSELETLKTGVSNAIDGEENPKSITAIISGSNETIKEKLNKNLESTLKTEVDKSTKAQVEAALKANGITDTNKIAAIVSSIDSGNTINSVVEVTTSQVVSGVQKEEIKNVKAVATGIDTTLQGAKEQLTSAISEKGKDIVTGFDQLQQGTSTLKTSVDNKLVKGTQTLAKGTQELSAGSTEVKNGLNTLNNGTEQLNTASGQLTEGAQTLSEGATTLSEGITTFNKEGIEKICNYINGDAKDLTTRVEKLTDLSKNYNNFTMLENGNEGNVKFIMIIDAIKKQENSEQNKEEAVLNTNIINENK